jgi:type IV pilus assembly protein PilB
MKYISEEQLALALALRFGLPYVDLSTYQVDPFAAQQVAPETCKKYNIFPFEIQKNELRVAFPEPAVTNAKEELQFITGLNVKEYIASQKSISEALEEYIAQESGDQSEEFEDLMLSETDLEEIVQSDDDEYDITESSGKEETIIALVNHILKTGVKKKASDIHINPEPRKVNVDFRIDGKLHRELNLPKDRLSSLVARMKILSNMNIAERRLPQDGRAKIKVGNKGVDLRFSCMPTVFGESVVIRILDKDKGIMKLDEIGLYEEDVNHIRRTIAKPYGMILITGPTGSGKSSTIYSCLQEPVFLGKNIITLEDPVEYEMPGVCQVQIRESIGFTFARGLRQILRHDPDVITVGEIRDSETAQIGIQAALTGHLLVSTLHTNSAAEVFVRLADMGIEPYLISASIIGAMSQRLIRRLCDKCKEPDPEAEIKLKAGHYGVMPENGSRIFKAVGCKACNSTGYKGRIMIYEYLTPNEDIKRAVLRSESSSTLKELAVKNGMQSLEQVALTKAEEGLTSVEEILPLAAE